MKLLLLMIVFLFSFSSFAADKFLKCELFENDQLLRSATQLLDANGEAEIDLGMHDIYSFGGFVFDGYPATMIISPAKSKNVEYQSDSVISSSGTKLTITCSL